MRVERHHDLSIGGADGSDGGVDSWMSSEAEKKFRWREPGLTEILHSQMKAAGW